MEITGYINILAFLNILDVKKQEEQVLFPFSNSCSGQDMKFYLFVF